MIEDPASGGRRERAKEDKRRRIAAAARELFAEHGVGGVTTQQIADRADVAIGTLFLYAATKAELLIMVQNRKFGDAIENGLLAARDARNTGASTLERVMALVQPVVACIREQPENGRAYLHELVFGDPAEPHRRDGLTLAFALEDGLAATLALDPHLPRPDATTLARVVTAIIHVATTATILLGDNLIQTLAGIRSQIAVTLPHDSPVGDRVLRAQWSRAASSIRPAERAAGEGVRILRSADAMESEVGPELGRGEVLLRQLPAPWRERDRQTARGHRRETRG